MMEGIFAGMLGITLLLVVYFIYRPPKNIHPEADASNIAINKSRISELEQEVKNQTLSSDDLEFYEQEVTSNLATDLETSNDDIADAQNTSLLTKHILSGVLVIGITLLTLWVYQIVKQTTPTTMDIDNIATIEKVVRENPEDVEALRMLGLAHNIDGNITQALDAYKKAYEVASTQEALTIDILTEYAAVLATLSESYEGLPSQLVAEAITLFPQEPKGLYLAGVIAANNGDFSLAKTIWERALSYSEEGSADYELISTILTDLALFLTQQEQALIEVVVTIDEDIYKEYFDGFIMVFARTNENPMPVVISKIPLREFTGNTTLSDENSIMPTNTLSSLEMVNVVVRLSKTGGAIKQVDDFEVTQENVPVKTPVLEFSIP